MKGENNKTATFFCIIKENIDWLAILKTVHKKFMLREKSVLALKTGKKQLENDL